MSDVPCEEETFRKRLEPHRQELMHRQPARAANVVRDDVLVQVCTMREIDMSQGITDSARVWRAIVDIWYGSSILARLRAFMRSGLRLLAAQDQVGPTSALEEVDALDDEICTALQKDDATSAQLARWLFNAAMDYLPLRYAETGGETAEYVQNVQTADMCVDEAGHFEFIPAFGSPADVYVPPPPSEDPPDDPPPAYGDAWQYSAFVHDPGEGVGR